MMASLVVAGVLLLAMIAASGRGAVALPADARIPVHCGSAEHCFLVSKRAGLLIWPAVGAVLFGALGGITRSSLAARLGSGGTGRAGTRRAVRGARLPGRRAGPGGARTGGSRAGGARAGGSLSDGPLIGRAA
jgi:hypothetical protein